MLKAKNYKITIEYDGKDFYGWQLQKSTDKTIQYAIENAIGIILKENIKVISSGRTDSGVHALNQTANFRTNSYITNRKKFLYSVNSLLPKSITVKNIQRVNSDFHSRYSAKKREYFYQIANSRISINRDLYYVIDYKLNFDLIKQAIEFFKGNHSFKALCKNKSDKHNYYCNIFDLKFKKKKNIIIFFITSNRFLHSMVRGIVGCIIDIGRGYITLNEVKEKFKKGEKIKTKFLPSNALFLNKIYY